MNLGYQIQARIKRLRENLYRISLNLFPPLTPKNVSLDNNNKTKLIRSIIRIWP